MPSSFVSVPSGSHSQRAPVDAQHRLLLFNLVRILPTDLDQLPQNLDVKAGALRLGVDILDIAAERLAFFLETFDPLDKATQAINRDSARDLFLRGRLFRVVARDGP